MSVPASPATLAVRASLESDSQHGAVVPPLHLSSNYTFERFGVKRQYDYTRSGNPTRDSLADALCSLEGGAGAVVTASGMAALTLLTHLLEPDDLLIAPHDCYGGTYRLFEHLAAKRHFAVSFIDQTDPAALQAAFVRRPRMILVETPSNPLLRIVDIAAVSALARSHGVLLAVDNTFLSPILQQPIRLGADIVLHSTTKYLNGHSDVVGGAIIAATEGLSESLRWWANCLGLTGAPFDSYLTLRGIRTLHTRMRQHEESANRVARYLDQHPFVSRVYYPGLTDHPGHQIARSQQSGFGGMVSLEIDGGEAAVATFVEKLQHFSLAESLGGVESLVCHPPTMTHAAVSRQALHKAGIGDNLIRLSIGLEDSGDLLEDLRLALDAAAHAVTLKSVAAASC
jgi:cystathionine gamma-synthase